MIAPLLKDQFLKKMLLKRAKTCHLFFRKNVGSNYTPQEGVPQRSVIGPVSFTMYTSPLEDIIESHGFGRMIYANDTQVYVIFKHTDHAALIPKLEQCVVDIKA